MDDAPKSDRRVRFVIIDASSGDRDAGKVFRIEEKSAVDATHWALRVFLALARTGVQIDKEIVDLGLMGLAVIGVNAGRFMQYSEAKEIVDEIMTCVRIAPDYEKNPEFHRALRADDISEIATLLQIKKEVVELHLGFSLADAERVGSLILAVSAKMADQPLPDTPPSPDP